MRLPPRRSLIVLTLLTASIVTACSRAMVIVPARDRAYTARDTLYGRLKGDDVRITFRHDTTWRVDTLTVIDTLWRGGTRYIRDTIRIRDTVIIAAAERPGSRVPPVAPDRRDTIDPHAPPRTPTRIPTQPAPTPTRPTPTTPAPTRVDTVYRQLPPRVDTVRVGAGRVDTVFRELPPRVDTVRVAGQRTVFVPPGQYPPAGQCRVWIHDLPPGRQADPAPCNALGTIPAGAFILFNGAAYDFDYDWVHESRRGGVPAEIVALKRRGGR